MTKLDPNLHSLLISNKKKIIFFLIFILFYNCSFDTKTGIWGDSKKERERISELERKQKEIIKVEKIYSSESVYLKEKSLEKKIILSKTINNSEWKTSSLNHQNFLGNIYLPSITNNFLKKKIGKNKFSTNKTMSPLLAFGNNVIFSDDRGTIFNVSKSGQINWKKNIYKKVYKKINKNLVFEIYKNKIYIADNIGFIYAINVADGNLVWIKNYGISIKSNMKVFENNIFLIDQDNKIFSINTKDGSLVWDILTISSFIKSQNLLSLAVSKNGDLFALTSSADIFKIKGYNGTILWSRNTAESLYADATDFFNSSEIVLTKHQVIFSSSSTFFSYDTNNGNINWKQDVDSVATPIIDGKNIFVVTRNGYLVILDKDTGEIISSNNILKVLKKKNKKHG